jgi:hypothetical protein
MSERETRRKTYRLREGVVIGLTAVSGVLAILLTLIAVIHNEPIFLGGSGVSATLTIGGFIKLLLNGDHSASSASKGKEDRPGQAGPGEGTDP